MASRNGEEVFWPERINGHIGQRIRQLREMRGLRRVEVARFLLVDAEQLERFELGDDSLTAPQLHLLVKLLGAESVQSFFEGVEDEVALLAPRQRLPLEDRTASAEETLDLVKAFLELDRVGRNAVIKFVRDIGGTRSRF